MHIQISNGALLYYRFRHHVLSFPPLKCPAEHKANQITTMFPFQGFNFLAYICTICTPFFSTPFYWVHALLILGNATSTEDKDRNRRLQKWHRVLPSFNQVICAKLERNWKTKFALSFFPSAVSKILFVYR